MPRRNAGRHLVDLLDPGNTASDVWADTGYRSRTNEALLRQRMLVSHVHRKKPARRPGCWQALEQVLVQAFVAQAPDQALDQAVLHRLAWAM